MPPQNQNEQKKNPYKYKWIYEQGNRIGPWLIMSRFILSKFIQLLFSSASSFNQLSVWGEGVMGDTTMCHVSSCPSSKGQLADFPIPFPSDSSLVPWEILGSVPYIAPNYSCSTSYKVHTPSRLEAVSNPHQLRVKCRHGQTPFFLLYLLQVSF